MRIKLAAPHGVLLRRNPYRWRHESTSLHDSQIFAANSLAYRPSDRAYSPRTKCRFKTTFQFLPRRKTYQYPTTHLPNSSLYSSLEQTLLRSSRGVRMCELRCHDWRRPFLAKLHHSFFRYMLVKGQSMCSLYAEKLVSEVD